MNAMPFMGTFSLLYLPCNEIHSGAAYSCTNEHESEIYESNIMCML